MSMLKHFSFFLGHVMFLEVEQAGKLVKLLTSNCN